MISLPARRSIKEQIVEAVTPRLERWMRVQDAKGSGSVGFAPSSLRSPQPSAGNSEAYSLLQFTSDQLAESERTDEDIDSLPDDEGMAVRAKWLWIGTDLRRAEDLECSVYAFWRRLDRAYERLYFRWQG